jgi:hypothetical protein
MEESASKVKRVDKKETDVNKITRSDMLRIHVSNMLLVLSNSH